jgi:RimJ/RimL family protein N-acetyltransferase
MTVILTSHGDPRRDEIFSRWAAKRIPAVGDAGFGPCRAVGIATGEQATDRLLAVFVFHDYQHKFGTVQLSGAAVDSHWASKSVVRGVLAVPFLQYHCHLVWSAIPHTSERVIRLAMALGFKKEAVLKDRFGRGKHAVIVRMESRDFDRIFFDDEKRAARAAA